MGKHSKSVDRDLEDTMARVSELEQELAEAKELLFKLGVIERMKRLGRMIDVGYGDEVGYADEDESRWLKCDDGTEKRVVVRRRRGHPGAGRPVRIIVRRIRDELGDDV